MLLVKDAIEVCTNNAGFYSNVSVVPGHMGRL